MILCVGEILTDMIGEEREGNFSYERKAGGAPFNVACSAKKFGAKSAFVGAVGADIIGDFLLGFVKEQGLDEAYVARDENRNTTMAFVELDKNGERSFCFYRKDTADFHLPEIPKEIFDKSTIVHIGSLMLSEKIGADYAERLAKKAKAAGKKVSFDVNFRTDIFRDTQSALAAYRKILELADIVKFSEDEVEIFTEEYIREKLADKLVCITLGGAGSEWRYNGKIRQVDSIKVKPVDTTGAGDAFYGGVLAKLDSMSELTEQNLTEAFRFANVCGALNTLGRGAIDHLPTKAEVEKYL